jgi:hypothetical protein
VDGPACVLGPEELVLVLTGDVGVNPESTRSGTGVVLLPDVGVINVANLILAIKGHQQSSIPDGDVTWHEALSFVSKP